MIVVIFVVMEKGGARTMTLHIQNLPNPLWKNLLTPPKQSHKLRLQFICKTVHVVPLRYVIKRIIVR